MIWRYHHLRKHPFGVPWWLTPKTALVILGGAFVRLSGHGLPRFLQEKPPHANPATFLKYQPNKKTKKNIQQQPQKKHNNSEKPKIIFLGQVFHIPFKLCGFPRFFGSTTNRDMSARANWFTATISIRRVSPLSSKTSQVRISPKPPHHQGGCRLIQENKWGY